MPEVGLDRAGVDALVSQLKSAGMTKHVGVGVDAEIGHGELGCCRPHGEAHFVATRSTPIDANGCVASLWKPLNTRNFHHFTAAARWPFSRAGHQ